MKICRPLWAEGTFLSSQQFQQQARWEAFSNDSIAQLCIRHPWGIANVLFDRDALMPGKLKTQAVRLRFADGTLIDSDVADILPPACDLRTLEGGSAIVLLALPLAHGNGGNLGQGEQAERPLRYRQEWQKVQDIYGSDSEDMAVERHALSLRFAHDNNQDYITCPLARLVRDVQGNWTQDEGYIPPLLAFNAHDGLVQRLDTLLLQLRAKCQRLMAMRRESNQRMACLGGTGLWGWSQLNQPDALIQRIQLSVMPLPQSLESGELAKLDVKDKALLAQDRTIAASQMQLEQLNKLPARWPLEQGYRQLRQLDALWPDNPQVRALNAQWRKQRELSALSAEALNGYAQAQSQLQRLSAQLDALDERKGRYLTGSELKTAVYGIRQSLKEPPLEELLRQLEEQKQTGEVSPTLLTQIDTRLNQLLNRYVILLDTKVEQSQ